MSLLKQINEQAEVIIECQQDHQIFESYGFNPDNVITLKYILEVSAAGEARAGEADWIRQLAQGKPQTKEQPSSRERGSSTEPQVGDTIVLPNKRLSQIEKHFMGKVTFSFGGKQHVVPRERLTSASQKGKHGETVWAITK